MSRGDCAIAVEIGGTALRIGIVDREGHLSRSVRLPSSELYDQTQATERLLARITEFLWEARTSLDTCSGIGIAAAGYVDNEAKKMVVASNLGWRNFPLGIEVEDLTALPVAMDKDTNMAALGELSARGAESPSSFIYAAIGTGVGGAIVHERQLLRGRKNSGGDFGHVHAGGSTKCGCGLTGCLETVAGGIAIARRARNEIAQGKPTIMKDMVSGVVKDISAETVARAAELGDSLAEEILVEASKAVGIALVNVIRMVGTEAVIIGGSLGVAEPVFTNIKDYVESNSVFPDTDLPKVQVLRASLGETSALVGAGLSVFNLTNPLESH